jgi:lysophospholipase L1-like esterase
LSHSKKYFLEPLLLIIATGAIILAVNGYAYLHRPLKGIVAAHPVQVKRTDTLETGNHAIKHDSLHRATLDSGICSSTYTGLDLFFESLALLNSQNFKIHIAYFGDSMIEGDLVTHPLRIRLQRQFGGRGIGFVPITSPQPGFRNTIHQQFNDLWGVWSFTRSGLKYGYYPGLSGYVFETHPRVIFRSESIYGPFTQASLIYSSKFKSSMQIKTDTVLKTIQLHVSEDITAINVPIDSVCSTLEIDVTGSDPGTVYGVNFESGPGIYIDNYAFRGNSGLPLRQIPVSIFSAFNKLLENKLIILHFGLNVFTPGVSDYHWYEAAMDAVISHVKASSPGVSILMVSMPDRSALIDGEYATPAELPDFIRMQERIASRQQIAFFSLFDAMGGVNSMKNWVEGPHKLAGEDYTHPNAAGAGRIASMIHQYLMTGYESYLLRRTEKGPSTLMQP